MTYVLSLDHFFPF